MTKSGRIDWTCSIVFFLLVSAMASAVWADSATTAWNGGSVNWSTAGNWGSGVPTTTNSALFNSSFGNQPQLTVSANAQGLWLASGVGQDVTIVGNTTNNDPALRVLTLTGTAMIGGQTNAGILLDDSANHNLAIGNATNQTGISLSTNIGFYVNNAGTLTLTGVKNLGLSGHILTLGGRNAAGKIVVDRSTTADAGALVVNTAGAVTLSQQNNHSGGTTLIAGTLNLNHAKAVGATAGTFTINGGTIDNTSGAVITLGNNNPIAIGGDFTFAGSTNLSFGADAVDLGGATRTITANAGTLTIGGVIDNGGITKAGAGTVVLSGSNTYTRATLVSAGVLRLSHTNALAGGIGAAGGLTALTINGGVVELANGNFLRDLGAGVNQVQIPGGTSGFSAYGGATRIVNFNNDAHQITWGSATFAPTTLVLNETTASASVNNKVDFQNAIDLGAGLRAVAVNANAATLSGALIGTGTGGLIKLGPGTLTLSSTNTYGGATIVSSGLLTVSNEASLPTNTALTVMSNAFVNLNGHTQTVASVSGFGLVSNGWLNVTSALYPGGSNTVGTLTLANLTLAEGLTIYWDYGPGGTDTSLVPGVANLPASATVVVGGSGAIPSTGVLFQCGTLSAPGDVAGWKVVGLVNSHARVIRAGNQVQLLIQSNGTVLTVR